MNGISGITSSMHIASGSLDVHSIGMQVSAHNVANISTDGFAPQRVTYATGSAGMGVELESVRKLDASGIAGLPAGNTENLDVQDKVDLSGRASIYLDILPQSGTELAKELPRILLTERGFQANAATVRAADDMLGSLINSIA